MYYALRGDISRLVAIGEVVGVAYYDRTREEEPGWPWLVPIRIDVKKDVIGEGFPLTAIEVERELTKSVQQKSHIRLRPAEYARARRAFGLKA